MALTDINSTLKNVVANTASLISGFNGYNAAIVTQLQKISGSGLVVGTTTITGGSNGFYLFDNAGVLGAAALPTIPILPFISVAPSGDTSGATDVTNINNATSMANSTGIPLVLLQAGTFFTNQQVDISFNELSLVGFGSAQDGSGTTIIPVVSGISVLSVGAGSNQVWGWGIKNIAIQTEPGGSSQAIILDSCTQGALENINLILTGPSDIGVLFFPQQIGLNTSNNNIKNIFGFLSTSATNAQFMLLTSGNPSNQNTTGNQFELCAAEMTLASQVAYHLAACDTNSFYDCSCFGTSPSLGATSILFDYGSGNPSWPNSHAFYTFDDGFNMAQPAMRNTGSPSLYGATNVFYNASVGNLSGDRAALSNVEFYGPKVSGVSQVPINFSALPTMASGIAGARAFVNDATSTTFGASPGGGGGNTVPVGWDGFNWFIGY